ncbi:MAG TPA: hypothetical protein VFQ80_00485 [Thermomicrobiales bacterium]|nr:hypothetical protein [Thermomicrobiales bacterium]
MLSALAASPGHGSIPWPPPMLRVFSPSHPPAPASSPCRSPRPNDVTRCRPVVADPATASAVR